VRLFRWMRDARISGMSPIMHKSVGLSRAVRSS
jgi:hypothetical protein